MREKIIPCLWFDKNAEEAAAYYAEHVPGSQVGAITRSPADTPSGPEGSVLTVEFTLAGQSFVGLNGGPAVRFTPAVSFQIHCDDQEEIDRLTGALSAVPDAEQCGWVKDRFGLSWQIVPRRVMALLKDADRERARRAMEAMMRMKRIDIAAVEAAASG